MSAGAFRSSGDLAADRRYLWAAAAENEKDFAVAADLYRQALEREPNWASAWFALGRTLKQLGDGDSADAAFRRCLGIEPADALGAALLLRQTGTADAHWSIPPGYVEGLFDAYADRFDQHLTGQLAYRGPEILRDAVRRVSEAENRPFFFDSVLDLGCGTGLMAIALDGVCGIVDGVDLSSRMLEKAKLTGRYRSLVAAEIVGYLGGTGSGATFDLVIAADVLVYIGDFAELMGRVRRLLTAAGLFAFTVQSCEGDGFLLGDDLRAAHSEKYLRAIAQNSGLAVLMLASVSTRKDAGVDVPGFCVVLGPQTSTGRAGS